MIYPRSAIIKLKVCYGVAKGVFYIIISIAIIVLWIDVHSKSFQYIIGDVDILQKMQNNIAILYGIIQNEKNNKKNDTI